MTQRKKILLNYVPPIRNIYPSAGLSILKSFLSLNGWTATIKYWNILMDDLMNDFPYSDKRNLIPFLVILADDYKDKESLRKIISYLKSQNPKFLNGSYTKYKIFLKELKSKTYNIIDEEFKKIDFSEIFIFGISLKFYQFIPGMFFARELKKRYPHIKTVVGGIRNNYTATELMEMCPDFDFSIWGEGEYPLLALCHQIEKQNNDFSSIPRLVYRDGSNIEKSNIAKSDYLDFENYIFPDYSDYPIIDKSMVVFPINSIRACYWDKCKFCIFSHDYLYRERNPENIIEEIEQLYKKYGIAHFHFIDNDIVGRNANRFIKLLDHIIESAGRLKIKYTFWGEIIHKNLNAEIFRKMAIAGFTSASFGLESISDNLLKKMCKRTNFADNLFALKSSLRFGIKPGGNILYNLPDESKEDVTECISNLHYLRFFYSDTANPFSFQYRDFVLQRETRYYSEISQEEIDRHNYNHIASLLPEKFLEKRNRFNIFGYTRAPIHYNEWNEFRILENYYKNAGYTYTFLKEKDAINYTELKNSKPVANFKIESLQWDVLQTLNDCILSFEDLYALLVKKYPDINKPAYRTGRQQIENIISFFKSKFLIYYNKDMSAIVSIVNTDVL
ncbi:MAG: radical SAM protein [Bacteroidia bacterium]|nr:radical SAM protein [Bacteroidia bacterium]